jgi:ribosomal protein S18 acetylase RimI-like enzyme
MIIPLSSTPLGKILAHETAYWSTIATVEPREGYCLFHNPRLAPRVDPNHAGDFRCSIGQAGRIVAEIVDFFTSQGIAPAAYVDLLAPPDLIPALLVAGFNEWSGADEDLMFYTGPDQGRPADFPVEVATSDQDRSAWAGIMEEEAMGDETERRLLHDLYSTAISDPRMTAYLIRIDGIPAARCQLFSTDGLGRVEAVRTRAEYRGRGLAAALVRHATLDSLERGNRITFIYAEPGSAPQRLYQRLGFRTVAQNLMRGFLKA